LRAQEALLTGLLQDERVFDDMLAQIDRNLELAERHLAQA
jgi:hypothetical protein